MDNVNFNSDIEQFFDFGEAALPEFNDLSVEPHIADSTGHVCPSHPESQDCICHGFMNDFDFNLHDTAMTGITNNATGDDFNTDFSAWIPRYKKPEKACLYCSSKGLDCFFTYEGQSSCSSCSALFRPCSFVQPDAWQNRPKDAMDTLHTVNEDVAFPFGGLTGIAQLKSYHGEGERNGRNSGTRFSRATIKILRDWLDEHADHPYPTEAEKEDLKVRTGLKSGQIANWLANARRRGKVRPKRAISPSIRPNTQPMDIPKGKTWDTMTPFDRWKYSPPENEPAPLDAIAHAINQFHSPPEAISVPTSQSGYQHDSRSASSECFSSALNAPSTTSFDTGFSALSSGQLSSGSFGSAWSYSTRNSFGSHGSAAKKERRRRRRPAPKALQKLAKDSGPRLFQCTFCTDTFKTKYDWTRHEKSLHISLEKWICSPIGEVITCSASGQRKCVFCDEVEPSKEHLEEHNYNACEEKGMQARTFYRKDHLRQHLRLMHGITKMTPNMENWKSEVAYINSRCGFCGATFKTWQDRVDHLAKEFRNGAKMADWKGCRGLDPHVVAQVTISMPPYLIANEAKSPWPFSASRRACVEQQRKAHSLADLEAILPSHLTTFTLGEGKNGDSSGLNSSSNTGAKTSPSGGYMECSPNGFNDHPNQNKATCWEILTLRLGRFAKQQQALGIPVTDDMLQREARQILYQDDDPWNQTAADNPEWLGLFKKAHGLEEVPHDFDRRDALEDLGILGGLSWNPEYDIANMAPDGTHTGRSDTCLEPMAFTLPSTHTGVSVTCHGRPGVSQADVTCPQN